MVLFLLEKQLRASKTAIVEQALAFYAKKELAGQRSILQYAGILKEQEAQLMLDAIQSSKHNKDIEIDL